MWGFPLVSREQALQLGIDAVVISANSIEDRLWQQAAIFRERGILTLRLYGGRDDTATLTPAAGRTEA